MSDMDLIGFTEEVRAMSGLTASETGEGEWYSERRRFDRVIANLGEMAAREIALEEDNGHNFRIETPCEIEWRPSYGGLYIGSWPLPKDYLRISGVRLEGVPETLTDIIKPGDSRHWQRYSEFPEIAGNPEHPKLYIVEGMGGDYMELHKTASRGTSANMGYIPHPRWKDGKMSFPEVLNSELIFRTSEKVRELIK